MRVLKYLVLLIPMIWSAAAVVAPPAAVVAGAIAMSGCGGSGYGLDCWDYYCGCWVYCKPGAEKVSHEGYEWVSDASGNPVAEIPIGSYLDYDPKGLPIAVPFGFHLEQTFTDGTSVIVPDGMHLDLDGEFVPDVLY